MRLQCPHLHGKIMPPAACCDARRLKESLLGRQNLSAGFEKPHITPSFPLGSLFEASGPLYRMLASMNNRCALRSRSELLAVSIIEMAVAMFFTSSRKEVNSIEVAFLRHFELTADDTVFAAAAVTCKAIWYCHAPKVIKVQRISRKPTAVGMFSCSQGNAHLHG